MLLTSPMVFKVLTFFSAQKKLATDLDTISTHAHLSIDQTQKAVKKLVEQNLLTQSNGLYKLVFSSYEKCLEDEVVHYEQILEKIELVKDRVHHIVLQFCKKEDELDVSSPILLLECISDDKKYIHTIFSDLEEVKIFVYTTSELMNLMNDPDQRKLTRGIILK